MGIVGDDGCEQQADLIVVLERGVVAEQGSYMELMKRPGGVFLRFALELEGR